jgi:hypothetical protein
MTFFFGPLIGVLGGVKVEKVCYNDYEIFKVYGTRNYFKKLLKQNFSYQHNQNFRLAYELSYL